MSFSILSRTLFASALIFLVPVFSRSQCPTCTPDMTCTSTNGFPNVCPLMPANATAGIYYEEQMTFYMPAEVVDPESGINATLITISLTSVSGLPYGLEFTVNDDDATFHPSEGENYGCATTCGTPLLPGTYDIVITIDILANAFGFDVNQTRTLVTTLVVDPGEGSSDSFSYDNIAACGGLEVNYAPMIVAPAPSITSYSWDFGNGETSSEPLPGTVVYDAPGDYTAILTTTISNFVLHGVSVSNLSDNWGGDEDFFSGPGDPYFQIHDANNNTVYSSAVFDNTTSATWPDPDLTLSAAPYTIQFFDEDDFTADDDLGISSIVIEEGTSYFDIGNGTVGTLTINLEQFSQLVDSAVVSVFPLPGATLLQDDNTLYFDDPDLEAFVWYMNDIPLADAFDSSLVLVEGGVYYAQVTNVFGCTGVSESYLYCPAIQVSYDELAMEFSVEDIYDSYQWYYNGLPLDGATNFYLTAVTSGNYAVEVTTDFGCETTSEVFVLVISVDNQPSFQPLSVFPNPVEDILNILNAPAVTPSSIAIYDILGKVIVFKKPQQSGTIISLDVSDLSPGVYFAEINNERLRFIRK